MADIEDVLESAQREIKAIGDNVADLKKSMEKDLSAVRKLAEDAPKNVVGSAEFKKDMDAITAGALEKHDALVKQVKSIEEKALKDAQDRMDQLEKKFNRGRLGSGGGDVETELKDARDFTRIGMASRGELKVGVPFNEEKVDVGAYDAYKSALPMYLRRDKDGQGVDMKAMSVGSDPEGGYFVTPAMGRMITGVVFETSPMRDICNVETISTDSIEYPRDDDEASAGWVGEQEDRSETGAPKAGMQRIPVHEMYAMPKVSQKLLEDASFDIENYLGRKIGDKFGRVEATGFVSGNGVKKPRGFLTYASGTYAAGSSGKIEQVAAGAGGAVSWDDFINTMTALKEYYLSGANWLMQRATVGKAMLLKDGSGRYIWQPNQQAGKPGILLGYEVRQAADMDTVSASKLPVAFGNFKMGYTIVDRIGISTLRDPFSAKPFVLFYTRKRVGGDVTNFEAIKLLAT